MLSVKLRADLCMVSIKKRKRARDPRAFRGSNYNSWLAMVSRCTHPSNASFHYYGARGITVDPAWLDFRKFAEDMGPRPALHSLDRIDNSLGYSKANCRWATRSQQNNNRRNNRRFFIEDQWITVSEIAQRFGVSPGTVTGWAKGENDHALDTEVHRRILAIKFGRRQGIGQRKAYNLIFRMGRAA